MSSDAESLVRFFESRLPLMKRRWRSLYEEGYKARIEGRLRQWHGRRYSGAYFKGWDAADLEIKTQAVVAGGKGRTLPR
jgi:hypothetical protein